MENLFFLLCLAFIVFFVSLFVKQIQSALEVTNIFESWLTPKIIPHGR